MEVTRKTLQKIAHLARLEIRESEEKQLLKDMSEILTWVEKLDEIDTKGVEPLTHMTLEKNAWREDKGENTLDRDEALKRAPKHDGTFFEVPKVIKRKLDE